MMEQTKHHVRWLRSITAKPYVQDDNTEDNDNEEGNTTEGVVPNWMAPKNGDGRQRDRNLSSGRKLRSKKKVGPTV